MRPLRRRIAPAEMGMDVGGIHEIRVARIVLSPLCPLRDQRLDVLNRGVIIRLPHGLTARVKA